MPSKRVKFRKVDSKLCSSELDLVGLPTYLNVSMRTCIFLSLFASLCSAAIAQSSDPPSIFVLKEISEERSEVRLLTSLFAPNTSSPWHIHPSAVAVYVEGGTGVWEIEGRPPKTVSAGQGLLEPANKRSRVTNILPTQVLKLVSFQISDPSRPFSTPSK